ncbi:MAG TPA: hypothetical protein VIH76_18765 [Candidatus Acidoferrales bacterium]
MSLRNEILKRIERKEAEVREHEYAIREGKAYLQGLQETLKLIPKDDTFGTQEVTLRHGSNIAKAHEALKAAGKPLHITEILKAIGQPIDKKHRLALGGSIAAYARKDAIFTKTAPNTFGLIEFAWKVDLSILDLPIATEEQTK